MNENVVQGIGESGMGEGELVEATEGERELGVEVKRGCGEAA